jgi:asparagine synthase (glutamine-hydrolysing)
MVGHGLPFFVVVPDSDGGQAVSRRPELTGPDIEVVRYPSGRPWIVGRWGDGEALTVRAGANGLTLVGLADVGERRVRTRVGQLSDVEQLTGCLRAWRGSYHAIATIGGRSRVQGTAYGLRRVYHTVVDGVLVAGDRAAVLAALAGAGTDRLALATRFMLPTPYPLTERPMWTDVHPVRPGYYLEFTHGGDRPRHVRWHRPPEPVVPLAEGAREVRAELDTAVALRVGAGGLVSTDMSGGLDSTSLTFLAARHTGPGELIACTGADNPATNDDLPWARRAAAHLPGVEHDVCTGEDLPLFYDGVFDSDDHFDRPSEVTVTRRRATAAVRRMALRGSRLHITGIGGDHLFLGQPAHYHSLITRQPRLAVLRLRGYRALFSWPWRDVLRALADRRTLPSELAAIDPRNRDALMVTTVRLGWLLRPRTPAWLTEECHTLIADALAAASADAEPLGPTRGRHLELEAIRSCTLDLAAWSDVSRRAGVPIAMPYFDDHVVDAALAVRVEDRTTPFAYKRLLAESMRGIVPDELFTRRTKATGAAASAGGLRRHREELTALWNGSALGELGLIDDAALRDICASPDSPHLADNGLVTTIACETWLRTATRGARSEQKAHSL